MEIRLSTVGVVVDDGVSDGGWSMAAGGRKQTMARAKASPEQRANSVSTNDMGASAPATFLEAESHGPAPPLASGQLARSRHGRRQVAGTCGSSQTELQSDNRCLKLASCFSTTLLAPTKSDVIRILWDAFSAPRDQKHQFMKAHRGGMTACRLLYVHKVCHQGAAEKRGTHENLRGTRLSDSDGVSEGMHDIICVLVWYCHRENGIVDAQK